jgi:TonB family protein
MRTPIAVALFASTALHAGLLFYSPHGAEPHDQAAPVSANPGVVIVAHLKNTLDAGRSTRARSSKSAEGAETSAARKPRMDNPMRFYPPEAIARGIEGETILMLRYKTDGTLLDAKIAHSSGHAILDQAALRAVRATPRQIDGPREVLFPVTFALQ